MATTAAAPVAGQPELLGQTVVLIGGSAGIGLETARRARGEGADVVLTGRDPDRLERAARDVDAMGVSEYGSADGTFGYLYGLGGARRRTALALDIGGFGRPQYQFLAFPAEEPPSIECNEDAGQELIDN